MGTESTSRRARSRIKGYAGLLALVLTWLAACSQPQPPLRVATIPWIGYQPLFLAQDLGHYPASAIRLIEFRSNTESLRAIRNRDAEAAALTLDEALLLAAEGHQIAVLLVLDCSAGADALVARPRIDGLSALAGARVGVESSANGAYVLSRVLHLAHLTPADVRIVPVHSGDQLDAYRTGQVDALVTYEPLRTRLAALGAETLFDSREIPCEIVDVLVVLREALREREGQIEQLLRGWFAAVEHQAAAPAEAAARLAPRLGMTPEEYLAAVAGVEMGSLGLNCAALSETVNGNGLGDSARRLAAVMLANGLLAREPDLSRLVERDPVQALGCERRPGPR